MTRKCVLVVDDDVAVRGTICTYLRQSAGYEIVEADSVWSCMTELGKRQIDAAVVDYCLPDGNALELITKIRERCAQVPVLMLTGHGSIELAVQAVKSGVNQFLSKPVSMARLASEIKSLIINAQSHSPALPAAHAEFNPFIGRSASIRRLEDEVNRVLGTASPILIEGETGTGKGVLARWIHAHGPRASQNMVDMNCASFSRDLLESEMFGYRKGAFTGAVKDKPGLLEVADGGTAFLDEIGDMDVALQPKLLKVLEEKRLRRVGDTADVAIDIHLITATHQDLQKLVAKGNFRPDLYYRINTIPLHIPSLRDRSEDILEIANTLLLAARQQVRRPDLAFSSSAMLKLQQYHWPGNIRELRNIIDRAALLTREATITPIDICFPGAPRCGTEANSSAERGTVTLREAEALQILSALQSEHGVVHRAAEKLGIPRSTLYAKIKQLGITVGRSSSVASVN